MVMEICGKFSTKSFKSKNKTNLSTSLYKLICDFFSLNLFKSKITQINPPNIIYVIRSIHYSQI